MGQGKEWPAAAALERDVDTGSLRPRTARAGSRGGRDAPAGFAGPDPRPVMARKQEAGHGLACGGEREPAARHVARFAEHAGDERDGLRSQALFHGPQGVLLGARLDEDEAAGIKAEVRQARGIEPPMLAGSARKAHPQHGCRGLKSTQVSACEAERESECRGHVARRARLQLVQGRRGKRLPRQQTIDGIGAERPGGAIPRFSPRAWKRGQHGEGSWGGGGGAFWQGGPAGRGPVGMLLYLGDPSPEVGQNGRSRPRSAHEPTHAQGR